ncbi:MAG: putative metalloprotease with PDZ domain [Saprospiraceae bacterium]|jgi:predicted metalloprotease with PDZ domain
MKSNIRYKVGSKIPGSRFLDIEITVNTNDQKCFEIALPAWRPGRYELGNFAKYIRGFKVFDADQNELAFKKQNSHVWSIDCAKTLTVTACYQFYTTELNAGSSWVDKNQLYINPVNCLMYVVSQEHDSCTVEFDVPSSYQIATGLSKSESGLFTARNFNELADSPVICSPNLQHKTYLVNNITFHVWFQGEIKPNWDKLIPDFTAFTKKQLESMGSFPFNEYHFLFQILPHKAYHGVEHLNSTVISLGPGTEVMETKLYEELLGVSSHELFHAWNVKSIRPADMLPYDFSKENYTEMGYLTEGITTCLGDLFLIKSGIFNLNRYLIELHKLLDRHSFNYGRYNYSVCESSFDTWLDGYVKGIPNRKGSIYTEGALLALCIDIMLISNTEGKHNLDTVMKALFEDYAKKGIGITEEIFIQTIKQLGGSEIESLFENYYHKAVDYFDLLKSTFKKVGLDLSKQNNSNVLASQFGCYADKKGKVLLIAPNSPAYDAGINVGNEIISVNDIKTNDRDAEWKNQFEENTTFTLSKKLGLETVNLTPNTEHYFQKYVLTKSLQTTKDQQKNFKVWLSI